MKLSFHQPADIAPYDEAADVQRQVTAARVAVEDALRRAHSEYRQAWTSYAAPEIISILARIQRRVERSAADLLGQIGLIQEQLDQAAKLGDGEGAFTLRHRALIDLGYLERSIAGAVESSVAARTVSMLRYDAANEAEDALSEAEADTAYELEQSLIERDLRVTVAGSLGEAHDRLYAARLGTGYSLLDTIELGALRERMTLISVQAQPGELAVRIKQTMDAAKAAGFQFIRLEED